MKKFWCGFSAGIIVGGAIAYIIGSLYEKACNKRLNALEEELNNLEEEHNLFEEEILSSNS